MPDIELAKAVLRRRGRATELGDVALYVGAILMLQGCSAESNAKIVGSLARERAQTRFQVATPMGSLSWERNGTPTNHFGLGPPQ